MPHVNIKHYPFALTPDRVQALVAAIGVAVADAFDVDEAVVSIALEPVTPAEWPQRVTTPEIVGRAELLRKAPRA